ncbi:uncharacterized protein LOC123308110 [Coccinella septempunctata]|uniref:uncharacterized protein LOC123308110 n=1 Tax=Coccinella septempunctata TaxID=41139 RepID=UPI001D06C480|nr:uncharacterized protein LOC123308110 [Coccinella septempunctata]
MGSVRAFDEFLHDINSDGRLPREIIKLFSSGKMVYKDRVALSVFCLQNHLQPLDVWGAIRGVNTNCTQVRRKSLLSIYYSIKGSKATYAHHTAYDLYSGQYLNLLKQRGQFVPPMNGHFTVREKPPVSAPKTPTPKPPTEKIPELKEESSLKSSSQEQQAEIEEFMILMGDSIYEEAIPSTPSKRRRSSSSEDSGGN